MLGTVISGMVLTAAFLFGLTPRYTAEAIIMIETAGSTTVAGLGEGVIAGSSGDTETIESEIEIIRSRGLAQKVINRLDLYEHLDTNEARWPKNPWSKVFGLAEQVEARSQKETQARERARRIDQFLTNLSVRQKGISRAIGVEFTSDDPKTAALIANTLADTYIAEELKSKFNAIQRVNAWLSKQVALQREKLEASERAVEEFRKTSGLLEKKGITVTEQQLSEQNDRLILARAERMKAEARLGHTKELINSEGGTELASDVLQSPLIERLREDLMEAKREAAKLSRQYLIEHPTRTFLEEERRDIEAAIKAEVEAIVKGFENEVSIAKARERSLEKSLNDLKESVSESNKERVRLRALEREAEANRVLLKTFLANFKQTSSQKDIDSLKANARIISPADAPEKPSFPNRKRIVVIAFVGSTCLGLLLVLVRERLDRGFRSGDQIEQLTGVPVLGLVPKLKSANAAPDSYISSRPASAFGESIRGLYSGIYFSRLKERPKTILITSAQRNEGKTTIAVCLAKMQALGGHKVVVVDTDFRKPSIHRTFGLPRKPGLSELLAGTASLAEVCQKDTALGITVVASGAYAYTPDPTDIQMSVQLNRVLNALQQTHDLVVLDSPPVMAVSDVWILSRMVDATVFVVHWADTKRQFVTFGLKQISKAGGRLAGVALSMVDVNQHARYSFGDSGYCSPGIRKYYASKSL